MDVTRSLAVMSRQGVMPIDMVILRKIFIA